MSTCAATESTKSGEQEFDLTKQLEGKQREKALNLIFRWTHRDYKSEPGQEKRILVFRNGTCSVPLVDLTDSEIAYYLPGALRMQAKTDEKRKQGGK